MKSLFQRSLDDYASYHRDPRNKLTHYLGIPMIVFTIIVFLRMVDVPDVAGLTLDLALLVMVPVGIFYLSLNIGTGIGMLVIFAGMYLVAPVVSWQIALVGFVAGWILQLIGHHFEGQSPAFFIADIAGRCANHAADTVLFHIFGHIDPRNSLVVIE